MISLLHCKMPNRQRRKRSRRGNQHRQKQHSTTRRQTHWSNKLMHYLTVCIASETTCVSPSETRPSSSSWVMLYAPVSSRYLRSRPHEWLANGKRSGSPPGVTWVGDAQFPLRGIAPPTHSPCQCPSATIYATYLWQLMPN